MKNEVMFGIPGNAAHMWKNGEIVERRAGKVIRPINGKIQLSLYDICYSLDPEWLRHYCEHKVVLPKGYEDLIPNIEFKPYNLKSHGVKLDTIVTFKEPVYYKLNHDFRIVPSFMSVAVAEDGRCIRMHVGKIFTPNKRDGAYQKISVIDEVAKASTSVSVHRLIAMAWVENDDYLKKPIVDHKDGIKANCYASNLEWVSFATNNNRAYDQGVKTDNLDVQVMDYHTNTVIIFPSVRRACKFMGLSSIGNVEDYCKTPTLIKERYQIKMVTDTSKWNYLDENGVFTNDRKWCVTLDGKRTCYRTLVELGKDLYSEVKHQLTRDRAIHKLKTKYPSIEIDFPDKVDIVTASSNPGYQVLELSTGKITHLTTFKSMVNFTDRSASHVKKLLRLGETYSDGKYSIRRCSAKPWSNIQHVKRTERKSVELTNVKTNETVLAKSVREAGRYLNCDGKTILGNANTNNPYKGYIISLKNN